MVGSVCQLDLTCGKCFETCSVGLPGYYVYDTGWQAATSSSPAAPKPASVEPKVVLPELP